MNVIIDFDTVKRKPRIISDYLSEIREVLSIENKSQAFIRRRFGRNMPLRKYVITNAGYFDAPFYTTLVTKIKQKLPQLQIETTNNFLASCTKESLPESYLPLNLEPRDYQHEAVSLGLKNNGGIIVLPTSAGKTLVIGLISNTIVNTTNHKTIILVPNLQLVYQTLKDFKEFGISEDVFSIWTGDNDYNPNCKITIANYQILLSKKQNSLDILKTYQTCIIDECHKFASAEKITKLIKQVNFKYIFGFTGSLPKEEYDIWSLNRIFGDIVYFKQSSELREQKFISNVQVVSLLLNYKEENIPTFTKPSLSNPTAGYEEEITWLQTNHFRNEIILKLIQQLNTNTLILVDRIVHGEGLLEFLQQHTTKQVYFVQGSLDIEEREEIRAIMEKQNDIVCIAISKIFSTGISIKNLHNIIFAAIGKARIKIIQSIGRSLRLHHSKEMATIFDIADVNLLYGRKHYIERKDLYETEKIPIICKSLVEK
jgi:superfamily II DNA or RNA helicase